MELRDGEVLLRPIDERDKESLVAGLNDSEVARFMTLIAYPYTSEDATEWLERCARVWANDTSHPFAIVEGSTNRFLGSIEVTPIPARSATGSSPLPAGEVSQPRR